MRLLTVKAKNFGTFGDAGFDLQLAHQGLVAVEGVNGTGKSTILDAIGWCLHGETGVRKETTSNESGLKGDDVVNEASGRGCETEVEFEGAQESRWRVRRWRKARPDGVAKTSSGVDLARWAGDEYVVVEDLDKANVQAAIDRALGFDCALFQQTVIRAQEDSFTFAQATPSQRFAMLTQIEGLEELDSWETKFAARMRQLTTELSQAQSQEMAQSSVLAILREEQATDATAIEAWELERQGRANAARGRVTAAHAELLKIDADKDRLVEVRGRIDTVSAHIQALVDPVRSPDLDAWEQHLKDKRAEHAVAYDASNRAGVLVSRWNATRTGECASCGQDVPAEHIERHKAEAIAAHNVALLKARALAAECDHAEGVVRAANEALQAVAASVHAQRRTLQNELTTLTGEESRLRAGIEWSNIARRNLETARENLALVEAEQNPMRDRATARAARMVSVEQTFAEAHDVVLRRTAAVGLCEWWVRAIPSLKSWIFDSVVGDITRETNRWLTVMTGGRMWVEVAATSLTKSGETRDKISLRCFAWGANGVVVEREFRRWSGGEKRRIALALDWALAARLTRRTSLSCSFLALDEVDRHLDDDGRAGLLAALNILRSEKETCVVVTHDVNMRARPDVRWIVTKSSTHSTVEVRSGGQDQGSLG